MLVALNKDGRSFNDFSKPGMKEFFSKAVPAHFLDEDFKLLSIIISFRNFNGQHLAKRIKEFVDYELIKLNINDKVVQTSTTDNAGDMKK